MNAAPRPTDRTWMCPTTRSTSTSSSIQQRRADVSRHGQQQRDRKTPMKRRTLVHGAAALVLAATALPAARAQQTFRLTIASSHPTTLPWVGLMSTLFVPEVNKRVEALGKGHKIEWREAYGGQLYKMNATLSSVEQGVTDIGWVFHQLEAAKMPLSQFGTVTPF